MCACVCMYVCGKKCLVNAEKLQVAANPDFLSFPVWEKKIKSPLPVCQSYCILQVCVCVCACVTGSLCVSVPAQFLHPFVFYRDLFFN